MSNREEGMQVTAARIDKETVELSPREEIQQRISTQLMDVYNNKILAGVEEAIEKFAPWNKWQITQINEAISVTKDATKYKSIALKDSFYQVKYEQARYMFDRLDKEYSIVDLISLFTSKLGEPNAKSKKPWRYNSIAYRMMWYSKENNAAVVVRISWRGHLDSEDSSWGIVSPGNYIQISSFIYYTILESDIKQFLGDSVPVSEKIIETLFNVAGYTDDYIINLPIQIVSLTNKKIPKKYKDYNQLFKLPNASIISLKFVDNRKAIENFVEKATGIRECPEKLPRWYAPKEGVCYTSEGKCPDYFVGEFPNAKGKLKDNDVAKYTFRVCSEQEARNAPGSSYELTLDDGSTHFVIREEPNPTVWEEHINKIFWTDFENSLAFYYNNNGELQKVNLEGYQNISNFDIVRLYDSGLKDTKINLGVAMREGGREAKWFETNPEDAQKFALMCKDLLDHVEQYANKTGSELVDIKMEADQREIVSSHVVRMYMKTHPDFKDLFVKFFSQVGATDQLIKYGETVGNRDAVALAKMIETGIDFDATVAEIEKLENEHLEIARDPKANTPFLPKDIKNFNSNVSLFVQQAIAVSMANNQKTAILDVDMGGGKTCMMVADICNQLSKGTATKPLIICPNKTLVQNKKEIFENWTDKRMNVFVLNTETYNDITEHGKHKEKLVEVMNKMPPNTIFMTSYNFLTKDKYKVPFEEIRDKSGDLSGYSEVTRYPIPQLLIQDVGIDMIYCDESQYIKNKNSGMSSAVAALSGANIKRITSGTIIPNNPIDLFAQLRFVDPSILGSEEAFISKYAEFGDGRGKIIKWKDGAQKQIREQIERKGGVSIRRSMWRWMMPKLNEKVHFVDLTPSQANLYEFLMTLAIEEIMKDPKLKDAYELMKEQQDDDETNEIDEMAGGNAAMKVLSILSRVTGYLAAPDTNVLVQTFKDLKKLDEANKIGSKVSELSFTEEDMIGPKIFKMKEIISDHFKGQDDWKEVGKVIVFTERIKVSEHAYEYLGEWKSHAVQYQAGKDTELEKFKNDDNIWILVACDKSIKEGQNLQVASRIIRLDIPWTPGDLNQSYARAYRNRQKKDVSIDIILCNGSMEICKYNNLISKEYIARKIISSFDEGDDLDFIPVKMNIKNMQTFKWDHMCAPYIAMHNRINEQELEESVVFGEKYKDYYASGVSKVGSREDIPGSELVYVPEPKEERILLDDEGRVIQTESGRTKRARKQYDIEDIGVKLSELERKYGSEEEDSENDTIEDDVQDTSVDEDVSTKETKSDEDNGLHLYFMQWDDELYLFTFYNKSSKFLRTLKFTLDNDPYYIKPLNNIQEIEALDKKLTKQGYTTNLSDYLKDRSLKKLFAKKQTKGALQRLMKHNAVVAKSKEVDFYISRIEGQMCLLTFEKIEGFKKLTKGYWYEIPNRAKADYILKKIAKQANITDLEELALDYKERFSAKLDVEALRSSDNKSESSKPKITASDTKKYNGKQMVLGLLVYAKAENQIKQAYEIWLDVGGLDFAKKLEKKGCTTITKSVKYLLENDDRISKNIIEWFNSHRGSVVAKFLNKYRKDYFETFNNPEKFVSQISK